MSTAVLLLAAAGIVAVSLVSLVIEPSRVGAVSALGGGVAALAAGGVGDVALLVAVCGLCQAVILSVEGASSSRPPRLLLVALAGGALLGVAVAGRGVGAAIVGVELLAAPLTALATGARRELGWIGLGALAVEALGVGVLASVSPSLAWGDLGDGPHALGAVAALLLVGCGALGRVGCAALASSGARR